MKSVVAGRPDKQMTDSAAAEASRLLLDLAHGKYDAELADADSALSKIGAVTPWAFVVKNILDALVAVNKATAPSSVVSDGQGGFVPSTNSKIGPDGNFA
jgi:hypothetical protein